MKKILFVNDLIYGGGVEKVLSDIVCNLPCEKYDITIYTPQQEKNFYDSYPGYITYRFGRLYRARFSNRILRKIVRIYNRFATKIAASKLNHEHFDVAVSIKDGECMKFVAEEILAEKKIGWVHSDFHYFHWTKYLFPMPETEVACMQKFNQVVCVSKATLDSIKETIGDPSNLIVRYNPVNEAEIRMKATSKITNEKSNKFLFVSVGRVVEQKGFDKLLTACNLLNQNGYENKYELWIVGPHHYKESDKILDFAQKHKLHNVFFLGEKQNPYPYMRVADCYVSSSVWESYGISIQESIVLGVPVISTACPAVKEVMDPNCGIFVEHTAEALYCAMKEVLKEPAVLQNCRDYIKYNSKDTFEQRIHEIEQMF